MTEIKIACDVKTTVKLADLTPFQGELKSLSTEDYERLKKEILSTGFAFPIYAWKKNSTNYIVGGHQRVRVLLELQKENIILPGGRVPVVFVQAKNAKEAKRRVLQDISQYGVMQRQGLYEFIQNAEIEIDNLMESFRFPEIDMKGFNAEFFLDTNISIGDGSKELKEIDFSKFQHQCPKCGFEFDDKNEA